MTLDKDLEFVLLMRVQVVVASPLTAIAVVDIQLRFLGMHHNAMEVSKYKKANFRSSRVSGDCGSGGVGARARARDACPRAPMR
jgi:hypothetical protein